MALCECGCGEDAGVYATTAKGHRKGEPRRYVNGHNWRGWRRRERIAEGTHYRVEDRGYETPCWIWLRTLSRKGYGRAWDSERGRIGEAHRLVYEQEVGPIPDDLQTDHLCRQRDCVNPAHMEPVTQAVNQQRGANAKLTREQADEIRRLGSEPNANLNALAREYGVSWPVVKGIVEGHLWPRP